LPFHNFCKKKLANSDITKEALNCTDFIAADSIVDAIVSSGILFCDLKISSPQIRIWHYCEVMAK